MASLSAEVKTFIIQALACFDTPSKVAESVKAEFGIEVSRQQVETHDPTKAAGRHLIAKWADVFHEARAKFLEETSSIPIANKAVRLRTLNRMAEAAESRKNYPLVAQLLEQAAKESGGLYTNKQMIDHQSSDGSMSPKGRSLEDFYGQDVPTQSKP